MSGIPDYLEDALPKNLQAFQNKYLLPSEAMGDLNEILDDTLCYAYLKGQRDVMRTDILNIRKKLEDKGYFKRD